MREATWRGGSACGACAAALVALAATAGGLTAQRATGAVRGQAVEAESGAPLAGAEVVLVPDTGGAVVASAVTDAAGAFALDSLPRGRYRVRVQRLGYAAVRSEAFELEPGAVLVLRLRLATDAVPLDPVTVTVERASRGRDKFAAHSESRPGVFVTRAEIDAIEPLYMRDVFRRVEDLRVRRRGLFETVIESKEGWGCVVRLIDELPWPSYLSWDDLLPQDVMGIEIYRTHTEVPPRYQRHAWPLESARPCGVILVWTRAAW